MLALSQGNTVALVVTAPQCGHDEVRQAGIPGRSGSAHSPFPFPELNKRAATFTWSMFKDYPGTTIVAFETTTNQCQRRTCWCVCLLLCCSSLGDIPAPAAGAHALYSYNMRLRCIQAFTSSATLKLQIQSERTGQPTIPIMNEYIRTLDRLAKLLHLKKRLVHLLVQVTLPPCVLVSLSVQLTTRLIQTLGKCMALLLRANASWSTIQPACRI